MIARILTPRTTIEINGGMAFAPLLAVDYIVHVTDVTGQPVRNMPTEPDILIVDCIAAPESIIAIDANLDYHILHSDNRPAGAIPDAAEFGLLRAYLARQKVSQATIREWIGTGAQGRTRAEIAAILREHLHDLPKAGD